MSYLVGREVEDNTENVLRQHRCLPERKPLSVFLVRDGRKLEQPVRCWGAHGVP